MALIRERRLTAGDPWTDARPDTPLTDDWLVADAARWDDWDDAVDARGLRVETTTDLAVVSPCLDSATLVVIDVDSFTDGRLYSQVRHLRAIHGYRGEIRVRGDVLPDQLPMLERVGVDSVELPASADTAAALASFGRIGDVVQPVEASDGAFSARWTRAA